MAGKYQPGDLLQTVHQTAIASQAVRLIVRVLAEDTPGVYRCSTNLGIEILKAEAELFPPIDPEAPRVVLQGEPTQVKV